MTTSPTAADRTVAPAGGDRLVVALLRITDLRPGVDPLDGTVTRDPLGVGLSAADASALEHALRIAEAWSARVVAICAGAPSAESTLREIAALGVTAVRVPLGDEEDGQGYVAELADDEQALARTLVAVISRFGRPELVVCGDQSIDRGTGALPAFVAHELGAAQALGLVSLESGTYIGIHHVMYAVRRLDGGWREKLAVPLPAVCSVEGAGVRLRRASLDGALGLTAGSVQVDRRSDPVGAGSVHIGPPKPFRPRTRVQPAPSDADPRLRLLALTGALVAHDPPTLLQPDSPAEAADILLEFLARQGYRQQAGQLETGGTQ